MPNGFNLGETSVMAASGTTATSVADQVRALERSLQPLIQTAESTWHGVALATFRTKKTEWETSLVQFVTELERLGRAVSVSGLLYGTADDEANSAVGATAGPTGGTGMGAALNPS